MPVYSSARVTIRLPRYAIMPRYELSSEGHLRTLVNVRHAPGLVMPIWLCQFGSANLVRQIWLCQFGYANLANQITRPPPPISGFTPLRRMCQIGMCSVYAGEPTQTTTRSRPSTAVHKRVYSAFARVSNWQAGPTILEDRRKYPDFALHRNRALSVRNRAVSV
jgi:hypothetical protein